MKKEIPVYQREYECEGCDSKGHLQTTHEPKVCPVCGSIEAEIWETNFILLNELPEPKVVEKIIYRTSEELPEPKVVEKIVEKIVYRSPEKDQRFGYRGPGTARTTGHRGVKKGTTHKIVNSPPIVTSVKKDNERRIYTVDCGYTGIRSTIVWHLNTWHNMTLKEAKDICKIGNHESVELSTAPPVCSNIGAYPVTAEILGYKLDPGDVRRYRFRIKECGYEGLRSSTLKHLVVHHGYTREDARNVVGIQKKNVDITNIDVRLEVHRFKKPIQYKPRVEREEVVKQKPPRKKYEYAKKQPGPKKGMGFIRVDSLYTQHTRPEKIEIVDVEYRQNNTNRRERGLRPYLVLNCGYKGVNNYCPMHIHRIHGVPLEEAKALCTMKNVHEAMAAKGKTEYRTVYIESKIKARRAE